MPENGDNRPNSLVWEFLEYLAQFRFLTADQVGAVWGIPAERIEALVATGWILRFELQDPSAEGPARSVYALGRAGAAALASNAGRDISAFPYLTKGKLKFSLMFLEHTLARNEFALTLKMATRQAPGVELLFWEHRPERLRDVVHLVGSNGEYERQPLVADGYFGLRVATRPQGRQEVYFLVEIDRGTVTIPRMAKRYRGYREWWRKGGPQERFGVPNIRVLTVAKGRRRVERLKRAAGETQDGRRGSQLFGFCEEGDVTLQKPMRVFKDIWETPGGGKKYSIVA